MLYFGTINIFLYIKMLQNLLVCLLKMVFAIHFHRTKRYLQQKA